MNFLKKIFSPVCLIISLLLLIYTFYKSEINWHGLKSDYYLTYYFISTLLIIFSIITFFINQKIKEYLIISTVSLIVSLYIFEGYLTFKEEQHANEQLKNQLYKKETGKKYDGRTEIEIYDDLKKVNNNINLTIVPSYYLDKKHKLFPLSSISNSEIIFCNEIGYYSIYNSDRYGFNNPDEEWDSKEIEYLLVGDSFIHGACVNRPNDIASVLRTLSNKSVLNLGFSENGPLIEYATIREYLNSNVKKILWVYYEENDLLNLENELNNKILKNYLNDLTYTQNLKLKQNEINKLANITIKRGIERTEEGRREKERVNSFKSKFFKFIKIYNLRIYISRISILKGPQPEFKEILKLVKDLTIKNNSKLYFVYLPQYSRYKGIYYNFNYLSVKKIVNELDIPFIDIHSEVFEKEENPLKLFPFQLKNHYNVEGYRKVAETIYKFTKD